MKLSLGTIGLEVFWFNNDLWHTEPLYCGDMIVGRLFNIGPLGLAWYWQ